MLRTFKFRVWHKEKKHMYKNVAMGVGEDKIGYKSRGKTRYIWETIENIVINQFTGYKDSSDKNIYENDILRFNKNNQNVTSVHWNGYKFVHKKKGSTKNFDKFAEWENISYVEILGNIHQNPELLKRQKLAT